MKHIIESQQFNQESLKEIFTLANHLEKKKDNSMEGMIMASLFYEPSTRTRFSFEAAMLRLGGKIITTENAKEFSSISKGETLEDSIRVISNYVDLIVLRHSEEGASKRASLVSNVPIINAGDGPGQHPTQAILDLYTIQKELNQINGISIALVGDLKNGRTVRSLSYLLSKYDDIKIHFISPKNLQIGDDIKEYLSKNNIDYEESEELLPIVKDIDVIYQTRIQKERFSSIENYEKSKSFCKIDLRTAGAMKEKSIIMHPLPRVDEILPEVDASPHAVYFKQAYYGLLVRMALLKTILNR